MGSDGVAVWALSESSLADSSIYRYEALLRASSAIATCRDGERVVQRFADELRKFIKFDYIVITVIEESTGEVCFRLFNAYETDENLEWPVFQPHETPSGWVYET